MSEEFLKWFGFWGTVISLLIGAVGLWGVYITWKAWNKTQKIEKFLEDEKARNNETVELFLTDGKAEYELKPPLRRREIIRNEIQGRLGTIPLKNKKEKFYRIAYINNPDFYEQLDAISNGCNKNGNSRITIKCVVNEDSDGKHFDEFNQFNFPANSVRKLKMATETPKLSD
jgi:uncharacterized membrane protein